MKKTLSPLWLMLATLSALWLSAEPTLLGSSHFFQWRAAIIQYSGILSIVLMSVAMVLALRLNWVERWTQGLDKAYRLHKWVGIGSVSLGVAHWLWYQVPIWLVQSGWLVRPSKPQGSTEIVLSGWEQMLSQLREPAMEIGEKGFYLLLILVFISLWSALKYKPFKLSHRFMSLAYLAVAFHSVALMDEQYWSHPIGYFTMISIIIGSIAALYSLMGWVGRPHRVDATVVEHQFLADARTLKLTVRPNREWHRGHAGQFAYLTIGNEEPHPFTMVSDPQEPEVQFLIKELGDFTTGLHHKVALGDQVKIEGPYGQMQFEYTQPQIWIAGGVGIASFLAALAAKQRAHEASPSHAPVSLYYCTRERDKHLETQLAQLCDQAGVNLTIIDSTDSARLSAQQLYDAHGTLSDYQFYFCGPEAFSKTLRQQLRSFSVNLADRFHEELFSMR